MYLKALRIRNFRNILDETVYFHPKINLILGENAQGKTSLLEAIYLLGTGKSFRAHSLHELIFFGKDYFLLEAEIEKLGISETLQIFYNHSSKKIQYNATQYRSFSQLFGLLPTVVMTPYDIQMISSMPSFRRKFLNLQMAQHDPLYIHHFMRYDLAMKQRNALLKAKKEDGIDIFEEQMALSAQYLIKKREEIIQSLEISTKKHLKTLKIFEDLTLKYLPSAPLKTFLNTLQKNRKKELMIGSTLQGAHRDDFLILLHQKKAKDFASEGQKTALLSALKFSEWEILNNHVEHTPILGIDDFATHLDPKKQELLQKSIHQFEQVFITSASIQKELPHSRAFVLEKGHIKNLVSA